MASPHVSGVAALMYEVNPDLTVEDVKDCIIGTAVDDPKTPIIDEGAGMVDTRAALQCAHTLTLTAEDLGGTTDTGDERPAPGRERGNGGRSDDAPGRGGDDAPGRPDDDGRQAPVQPASATHLASAPAPRAPATTALVVLALVGLVTSLGLRRVTAGRTGSR